MIIVSCFPVTNQLYRSHNEYYEARVQHVALLHVPRLFLICFSDMEFTLCYKYKNDKMYR